MKQQRITFIGAGNMASAIISGLVSQGVSPTSIVAAEPDQQNLDRIRDRFGIGTDTDNLRAVTSADVVVLSVKPQILQSVCREIAPALAHGPLVISIAAGVDMATITSWLGAEVALVRCMPNTPAQVLAGASGLVANSAVSDAQRALAFDLFSAIGVCQWLDSEEQMHAITALSGSGPAYIFLVIEAMEKAAIAQGIDENTARQLAAQTVLGAAQMVLSGELEPAQLKKNVMSPGGTTERAIQVLEAQGLSDIFAKAMDAAAQRSRELADVLKGEGKA